MSRGVDLALTLVLAPLAGPMGLLAALVVWVADGRPALFVQERVGRGRRPFGVLKLRTMRDGRVTGVGRILRRTGLDEVPQLVNVVRGEMSLVGPRPITQADVDRLGWEEAYYDCRWSVRPGIVGPSQFQSALRCDARFTWAHDRAYVRTRGLRRDIGVLAAALLSVVAGRATAARVLGLDRGSTR